MGQISCVSVALLVFFIKCQDIAARGALPDENDELVSVAVLYRHGDRGPITSYPNDPYLDIKYWPEGLGQLINAGKMRQFELGKWLRSRYQNFLSENYSPEEILVLSSNTDRCPMSAAANLAGLYTPTGPAVWLEDLPWEPVPIHAYPEGDDNILAMSRYCSKYTRLYQEAKDTEYFKNILTEYGDMVEYVSKHTGWNITDISTFGTLQSVFYVYQMHNSSYIPAWGWNLDPSNFTYLAGLKVFQETFTQDLKRLKTGPFFYYLLSHFDNVIDNGSQKFRMLSAHDTTVASVLNAMGVYDYVPPEFTSTVIWELRKDGKGSYYINMFYKRPSVLGLKELVIESCGFNCDFGEYKKFLGDISVDDGTWEQECQSVVPLGRLG